MEGDRLSSLHLCKALVPITVAAPRPKLDPATPALSQVTHLCDCHSLYLTDPRLKHLSTRAPEQPQAPAQCFFRLLGPGQP